jgi:Trk K+ transport system NAD-binding subunit
MNDYYANRPIRVGIVGAGKLGLSLAKLFNASKQLVWVVERNDSRRRIL